VIGSTFTATYRWHDRSKGEITPTISGSAHVTGEAKLRLDPADPFCWGIRA
jgi:4-hydroxyproline epimerase